MSSDKGKSFTPIGAAQGLGRAHVGAIGFDPVDAGKFYIGTEEGLYKTVDGGTSFFRVIYPGYISDIIVCKSNPLYVYAAYHSRYNHADAKIYRSVDGGTIFKSVSENIPSGLRILKIISDPKDHAVVYFVSGNARFASGSASLYRSIDSGVSFTDISGDKGDVMDADIDPVTSSTLYMTTYSEFPTGSFFASVNRGDTWGSEIHRTGGIFVRQDEPGLIRMIDPRATSAWNEGSGTWESADGGATWYQTGFVTKGWETGYNKDVSTIPYWDIFRSYNGTGFEGEAKGFGKDMSDPDVILWANSQFVFRSADGGKTFNNIFTTEVKPGWWQSRGIDNVNMMDMAVSEVNSHILYAGYFDLGFWRSLDGGESWQSGNQASYTGIWDGYGGNVSTIATDPDRTEVVWATMSENQSGEPPTYLLKSTNYGERGSWSLANSGLPEEEVMGLSVNRQSNSANRTLYVTAQGHVYKSVDDGSTWFKLTDGLPEGGGLRFTSVDHFDGNIVYAGGGSGLYASTNGGSSWMIISTAEMNSGGTVAFWPQWNGKGIFDIAPDPQTSGTVYVTIYGNGKGLYRGAKGTGSSWNWQKLYTDNYMRKVCIDPSNNRCIYVTSSSAFTDGDYNLNSHGVICSYDKFATFFQVNSGMAWPFAMTVKIDKENNVIVGSPGTGFQKSAIPVTTGLNAVSAENQNDRLFVFPNPVSNTLNFQDNLATLGNCRVEIYNLQGQCLLSEFSGTSSSICVSMLKNGLYFISVSGAGFNYRNIFIKENF
jgi:hypothetical protein